MQCLVSYKRREIGHTGETCGGGDRDGSEVGARERMPWFPTTPAPAETPGGVPRSLSGSSLPTACARAPGRHNSGGQTLLFKPQCVAIGMEAEKRMHLSSGERSCRASGPSQQGATFRWPWESSPQGLKPEDLALFLPSSPGGPIFLHPALPSTSLRVGRAMLLLLAHHSRAGHCLATSRCRLRCSGRNRVQAAERRRRTWLFLAVHSALEVTSSFCASGMVTRMALMGLGRDGETQQCLVQCRCSVRVRTNRAGMMENTRIMEDPHFLTRLGPGVGGGRLEWGAGQAATCPHWAAPSSERKKPPVSTAPHQPRGRGVSSRGLQSMAPSGTPT